VSRSAAN